MEEIIWEWNKSDFTQRELGWIFCDFTTKLGFYERIHFFKSVFYALINIKNINIFYMI